MKLTRLKAAIRARKEISSELARTSENTPRTNGENKMMK